jgi:hypothetical protein
MNVLRPRVHVYRSFAPTEDGCRQVSPAKVVLFKTMSLLIPNHHASTVALPDPMADDADRTLELQWAERKHQLLRQRRLREASEDHGTTKRDDVLVLPPAGTRFDAPVRVAFM